MDRVSKIISVLKAVRDLFCRHDWQQQRWPAGRCLCPVCRPPKCSKCGATQEAVGHWGTLEAVFPWERA